MGEKNLPNDLNKSILLLTSNLTHQTGRLGKKISNPIISFSTTIALLAKFLYCRHVYLFGLLFLCLVLTVVAFIFYVMAAGWTAFLLLHYRSSSIAEKFCR